MFSTATRPILHMRRSVRLRPVVPKILPLDCLLRRNLSVRAIYSSFPASLLRYNPRQKSSLFDIKDVEQKADDPYEDAVRVSTDSLVYPGLAEGSSLTNGAVFMPNTYTMQEIVRQNYDYYNELVDEGKDIEPPLIFLIPQGTPITNNLILFHEYAGRFSLQPSHAMSLEELNKSLDEFYAKYAEKHTAEKWLNDHPFQSAVADDEYTKWMGK